ncbi:metal ABC transporter solute-binding protein, Zn/Mn family [uncultured Corynebacterium sp.]|uniref:metal ABC transporter solute-binding protein, Zn/Mn family n=1 Tax=uncultured Corynebacterium sp. TaxID=159447 RepID=UPI0025E9BACF|nr:zinc ABC transporter substrate-binding protein [uncultured Corynebacterium sp.]
MRSPRHPLRTALAGAATLTLTLGLTACSGGSDDADADNADLRIVASTAVWGSIAQEVIDDGKDAGSDLDVRVSTILSGTDGDPHEYEATAQDIAEIRDADVVLGNGAGYDNWLTDNAATDAEVITAAPTAEGHDHDDHDDHNHDINPHVWFNLPLVEQFATNLASYLHSRDASFPTTSASVTADIADATTRLQALPAAHVLLTEPVAALLLDGTALTDVTPQGFAHATLEESEPSAADLATARGLITDGTVDVLITNAQAETAAAGQLTDAARDKGLTDRDAVVNVNESPDNGQSYVDYLDNLVGALEKATSEETPAK